MAPFPCSKDLLRRFAGLALLAAVAASGCERTTAVDKEDIGIRKQALTTSSKSPTLTAKALSASTVQLQWTAVSGAQKYQIKRSTDGGRQFLNKDAVAALQWSETSDANATTYCYEVQPDVGSISNLACVTTPYTMEAEEQTRTTSSGTPCVVADAAASKGKYVLAKFAKTGGWLNLALASKPTGTYEVLVGVAAGPDRGIFQLSVAGVSQGHPVDGYAATPEFRVVSLGLLNVTSTACSTTGFKFTSVGKNPASSAYNIAIDVVQLGIYGVRTEAQNPTLPSTNACGDKASTATDPAASNGDVSVVTLHAVGDVASYTVPVMAPAKYEILVRYRQGPDRGDVQLSIDGANFGPLLKGYAASPTYALVDLGAINISMPSSGHNHAFAFRVTGRDPASTGYGISVDYIELQSARGTQKLTGHIRHEIAVAPLVGPVPAGTTLSISVGLPVTDSQKLQDLVKSISDPQSPSYRQYLTPAQFGDTFGASQAAYQKLQDWAGNRGFSGVSTFDNRLLLNVNGTVDAIQKALGVKMNYYRRPDGTNFYAPDQEPAIDLDPADVPVLHVSNIENYYPPLPGNEGSGIQTWDGGRVCNLYLGDDFRRAYAGDSMLRGEGQCVGLMLMDGFSTADVAQYEGLWMDPNQAPPITLENVDGYALYSPSTYTTEPWLDVEMAVAMAPGLSQVHVVEGSEAASILARLANPTAGVPLCHQLSCSWVFTKDANMAQTFQQFAIAGQSFFVPSGDWGAYGETTDATKCGGFDPCQSAQALNVDGITVVGGTVLDMVDGGLSYVSEGAWKFSGGGILGPNNDPSPLGLPDYQSGLNNGNNQASSLNRNSPDVAMVAQGIEIWANSKVGLSSGTSAGAPLWAGLMALINQRNVAVGLGPVGFANPVLYAIGKSAAQYGANFNDISSCSLGSAATCNPTTSDTWYLTCDSTTSTCNPGYPVVQGYDLVTGWGSPKPHLIQQLSSVAPMALGAMHSCAIRSDGSGGSAVYCWGNNSYGQLGDGTATQKLSPVRISVLGGPRTVDAGVQGSAPGNGPVALAAGYGHTCALLFNGQVYCWGAKKFTSNSDGSLSAVDPVLTPTLVSGLPAAPNQPVAIAAGLGHDCALLAGGGVMCWGDNSDGQLGAESYVLEAESSTPTLSSGSSGSVATVQDSDSSGSAYVLASQLAPGDSLNLAIPSPGPGTYEVYALVVTVADNADFSASINGSDQGVLSSAIGLSVHHKIRLGQAVLSASAGTPINFTFTVLDIGTSSLYGLGIDAVDLLRSDASPVAVGDPGNPLGSVSAISAGAGFTCALRTDGTVWCWGVNAKYDAQLGCCTIANDVASPEVFSVSPVQVAQLPANVVAISCGGGHSCATITDGSAYCWGGSDSYELGKA